MNARLHRENFIAVMHKTIKMTIVDFDFLVENNLGDEGRGFHTGDDNIVQDDNPMSEEEREAAKQHDIELFQPHPKPDNCPICFFTLPLGLGKSVTTDWRGKVFAPHAWKVLGNTQ